MSYTKATLYLGTWLKIEVQYFLLGIAAVIVRDRRKETNMSGYFVQRKKHILIN